MIFVIQSHPSRDWRPLFERLCEQHRCAGLTATEASIGVVADDGGSGQLRTMLEVLRRVRPYPGAPPRPVTLLEDDTEICADFVQFVARHWRDAGAPAVQWYARGDLVGLPYVNGGWVAMEGVTYLCNQAVTFSPTFIGALFASPRLEPFLLTHKHDGDGLIGEVLAENRWRYALRVPGGAQHTGADSLVAAPTNRLRVGQRLREPGMRSDRYVGRDGRMGR